MLEGGQIESTSSVNMLQGTEDLGLLHHPSSQCRVQRGQTEPPVLEDFCKPAAETEQEYRTELWIKAAADDNLIAIEIDHRLHTNSLKMAWAGLSSDRRLDGVKCVSNGACVIEIEVNASHFALVGDRCGKELDNHGVANRFRGGHGRFRSLVHHGLDRRNRVAFKDLLGFDLGENCPALPTDRGDDCLSAIACMSRRFGLGGWIWRLVKSSEIIRRPPQER